MSLIEDHSGGLVPSHVLTWATLAARVRPGGRALLDRMTVLAMGDGAVDLRIGEILATLREMDLRPLGHTTYTAFVAEEVDFDPSWARQLARLARSDLGLVKDALCRGHLPVSHAVKAAGRVAVHEQADWIDKVRCGVIDPREAGSPKRVDVDNPEDAALVDEVRNVARTVMGHPSTDQVVDRHIRRCWEDRVDGSALVRQAMQPSEPFEPRPLDWSAGDGSASGDAAAKLLGPRVVPEDVHHGLALLRETLKLRRTRRVELGLLYHQASEQQLYREMGFTSLREMAELALPITQRTLQKCREQALAVSFYPELESALAGGMDVSRLMAVFDVATDRDVGRWLAIARRTTCTELRRAVQWAHQTEGDAVLEAYEHALVMTNDAHSWVALRAARRPLPPPKRVVGVHPDLVEACRWYKANVRLPRQYGFGRVKERERFTCENPLCNRRTLRCDAHHRWWRVHGGGNEDSNAACVCKSCHLRGLHASGRITLERAKGGPDVWTYPTGLRILVF